MGLIFKIQKNEVWYQRGNIITFANLILNLEPQKLVSVPLRRNHTQKQKEFS